MMAGQAGHVNYETVPGIVYTWPEVATVGATEDTLKGTLWDRINGLVVVMEKNGFELPPGKNFKSVAWHVGAGHMMACVPVPQDKKLAIAPKMRGRHGEELIAVVDEAMGLVDRPDVLNALEDGFDGDEDRICFLMNPDAGEATGPWYERCRSGAFAVLHESSFQHVNVMERRIVVPGAVSPHKFDQRVRFDCVDRGPLGEVEPDPDYHDFSYALPPKDAEADYGARPDGVPGWNHPAAVVHVFRPNRRFTAAKIGEFVFGEPGLCPYSRASLLESHNRYLAEDDPKDPPDRVGVDPNRGGKDSAICVPAWGPAAPSLLQQVLRWRQKAAMSIVRSEDDYPDYVRAGAPVRIPDNKIKGPEVAEWLDQRWPDDRTSFVVDSHGVGASVADHLERLGRKVAFVEGPTAPEALLDDEEPYENKRCQGYLRTAALLRDGLLDLHPSEIDAVLTRPSTAQQLLAIRRDITSRRTVRKVYVDGQKVEKVVAKLMPKKQMKAELLGHNSPDEADALVLAVAWETWTGTSLSMCGRY